MLKYTGLEFLACISIRYLLQLFRQITSGCYVRNSGKNSDTADNQLRMDNIF